MKVRLTGNNLEGRVITVPSHTAAKMIRNGLAVPMDAPTEKEEKVLELAVFEPEEIEKAILRPKRVRKKRIKK